MITQNVTLFISVFVLLEGWESGSTVLEVLCYKSEVAVLQIGRSLVRFQMVTLELFINIILPMALGSTQPRTGMSTRSISWG